MKETGRNSIGCVVMAAGNAVRYGDNKLMAQFQGKTIMEHVLEAVPSDRFTKVCVVTQYDEVEDLAGRYGFLCIRNERPQDGISRTVRLGTRALMDECDAILYLVSDQPLLRRESLEKLLDCCLCYPDHIVCASWGGKRGNPCIFPRKYYPELLSLQGDAGGSTVIKAHKEALLLCETGREELADVDTKEDLLRLRKHL